MSTDGHENRQPLRGLRIFESGDHRLQSKTRKQFFKVTCFKAASYFSDFDETPTTILLNIQVKPF
jgi:hypothetical protein